jgi:hypothetical protein
MGSLGKESVIICGFTDRSIKIHGVQLYIKLSKSQIRFIYSVTVQVQTSKYKSRLRSFLLVVQPQKIAIRPTHGKI